MIFVRTKLVSWFTFGFAAGITLFPFILIAPHVPLRKSLVVHEQIHFRQQLELLVIPFYLLYLVEYLVGRAKGKTHYQAYRSISFEREAFSNEGHSLYLKERKNWSWFRYI